MDSNCFPKNDTLAGKYSINNTNQPREGRRRAKNGGKRSAQQDSSHSQLAVNISPGGYLIGPETIDSVNTSEFSIKTGSTQNKRRGVNNKNEDGLVISLNPQCKIPIKELLVKMTLKNSLLNDIRVYDLELTVNPKVIKFQLDMTTTARLPVIQDLPILNSNNVDVIVKPSFEILEGEKQDFEVSTKPIKVKKKSVEQIRIIYCSPWISKSRARLVLFNQNTNEKTVYDFTAVTQKPLNEGELNIHTSAGEPHTFNIHLENNTGKIIEYVVDCKIPNSKFEKKFCIKPNTKMEFPITFFSNMSGEHGYIVKFFDIDNRYIWYLVNIVVEGSNVIELSDQISTIVRYVFILHRLSLLNILSNSKQKEEVQHKSRKSHGNRKHLPNRHLFMLYQG